MSVKTTGKEFKRFYEDREIWGNGQCHDDEVILVNGVQADMDYSNLNDTDVVEVKSGNYWPYWNATDQNYRKDLVVIFENWKKIQTQQKTTVMTIEIPSDKFDECLMLVKELGRSLK